MDNSIEEKLKQIEADLIKHSDYLPFDVECILFQYSKDPITYIASDNSTTKRLVHHIDLCQKESLVIYINKDELIDILSKGSFNLNRLIKSQKYIEYVVYTHEAVNFIHKTGDTIEDDLLPSDEYDINGDFSWYIEKLKEEKQL